MLHWRESAPGENSKYSDAFSPPPNTFLTAKIPKQFEIKEFEKICFGKAPNA